MLELELHQLDLRYAHLRRRSPEHEKRLLASLALVGQQMPIVVLGAEGGRHVVLDGYKRVRALRQLKADTVRATAWELDKAMALVCERLMRCSGGDDAFQQGWLLRELEERFGLSQQELARRFDRSGSWVCRRLSLVKGLPEEIQERVRRGELAPHAAMKYLVPLARANRSACLRSLPTNSLRVAVIAEPSPLAALPRKAGTNKYRHLRRALPAGRFGATARSGICREALRLVESLGSARLSTRQRGALYGAWLAGDTEQRERIVAEPELFLRAQQEALRTDPVAVPPAAQILADLDALGSLCRRGSSHLRSGLARPLAASEREDVARCLLGAKAQVEAFFSLVERELADAGPEPTHSHP